MPVIPSVDTFIEQGLNKRATLFGCGDERKVALVFLPNAEFTYMSGVSTEKYCVLEGGDGGDDREWYASNGSGGEGGLGDLLGVCVFGENGRCVSGGM